MFKKFFRRPVGYAFLAMTVAGQITSPVALAVTPIKIMTIGDSITNGGQGYASYRYPLYFELQSAGYNFDFVGSQTTTYNSVAPNATLYPNYNTTFDKNHEGYWGITTTDFLSAHGTTSAAFAPDIVTIHLGTNDLGQNLSNAGNNYQPALNNLGSIISDLRAANPNVKIVLSQVIPSSASYGNASIPGFNTALTTFAAAQNTVASPISLIDQNTGYNGRALNQSDGIHPTQYGEQLMADRYYIALQPLLSPAQPIKSPVIHLGNISFDDVSLSDGTVSINPASQAWGFNTPNASIVEAGIFNPNSVTYTGAGANGSPSGALGANISYVINKSAVTTGTAGLATITQTIGAILSVDTIYALTVAIGNRLISNPYGTTYGGYLVELLAGNTVIASQTNAFTPTAGTFGDASFSVNSDSISPSLLGQSLTIRLSETSMSSGASTDFDNVRLVATPVPEPSSIAMFSLGGLALYGALRARRKPYLVP